jgi:hypothetical protein
VTSGCGLVTAKQPQASRVSLRIVVAIWAILLPCVLSACGGNGTSGLTGIGKVPVAHDVAIADCSGHRSVEPVTIVVACADGNQIVEHARWSAWDGTSALGTGVLTTNDCQPTCGAGTFHSREVDLVAKVPVGRDGNQSFSVLVVTPTATREPAIPVIFQLHRGT